MQFSYGKGSVLFWRSFYSGEQAVRDQYHSINKAFFIVSSHYLILNGEQ